MTIDDEQRSKIPRPGWISWGVSAINAAMGDYLRDQRNGLAIEMALYQHGRPLPLRRAAIAAAFAAPATTICLFVHGLGCTEGVWTFRDPAQPEFDLSYGEMLAADLGVMPLYLRYNTGLSVAENGRQLADLLDTFGDLYPAAIDELWLVGHSMGGLVLRSACHEAELRGSPWARRVTRMFYLGTPHAGADLARLSSVATDVLHAVPHPITRLIGTILDRRSRGVKDLQHGTLREPEYDPAGGAPARPLHPPVPWLAGARHYLIAGTVADPEHVTSILLGDGLVATPRPGVQSPHDDGSHVITPEHIRLFPGVHHLQLAGHPAIYQQIRQWCEES